MPTINPDTIDSGDEILADSNGDKPADILDVPIKPKRTTTDLDAANLPEFDGDIEDEQPEPALKKKPASYERIRSAEHRLSARGGRACRTKEAGASRDRAAVSGRKDDRVQRCRAR